MAKTKISEFSSTPGNNTDIDSINIAEGCAPSGINNAIRELMAQLKDFQTGAAGDSFNGPIGTTTAAAGAFTTLSASSTVSGTGFSNYLASPPAIGGTAAAAGSFTTLTTSSTVTHNGGTANGVAYLNGSKVLTTGSALTFDGTNLSNAGRYILSGANSAASSGASLGTLSGGVYLNTPTGTVGYLAVAGAAAQTFSATEQTWAINNSEQMRLTSTGLGIGTSSPAYKLDANSASNYVARFQNSTNQAVFNFSSSSLSGIVSETNGQNAYLLNSASNYAVIYTGGAERARIDSSGNLLVGTTSQLGSSNARVNVSYNGSGLPWGAAFKSDANNGIDLVFISAGNGAVGSISHTSTTTSYNTTSDQRLKENIQDAAPASALIDALQVRQYDWKADGNHQRYGFVAQELLTVAPEAVHQPADPEAMMAVDYSKLVPMLVKEIQSLRQRLAALESN